MAKKATGKSGVEQRREERRQDKAARAAPVEPRSLARQSRWRRSSDQDGSMPATRFVKLLQSPLVADWSRSPRRRPWPRSPSRASAAGRVARQARRQAVKAAGKAAAAAVGRRLGTEIDEIKRGGEER